jgi:hypothetical protein
LTLGCSIGHQVRGPKMGFGRLIGTELYTTAQVSRGPRGHFQYLRMTQKPCWRKLCLIIIHFMTSVLRDFLRGKSNGIVSAENAIESVNGWMVVQCTDADMKTGVFE